MSFIQFENFSTFKDHLYESRASSENLKNTEEKVCDQIEKLREARKEYENQKKIHFVSCSYDTVVKVFPPLFNPLAYFFGHTTKVKEETAPADIRQLQIRAEKIKKLFEDLAHSIKELENRNTQFYIDFLKKATFATKDLEKQARGEIEAMVGGGTYSASCGRDLVAKVSEEIFEDKKMYKLFLETN